MKQEKNFILLLFKLILILLVFILMYKGIEIYINNSRFSFLHTPFTQRLSEEKMILEVGERAHIYVVGYNTTATYSSLDYKVVQVNQFGFIKAKQVGSTIIEVKVDEKKYQCKITVIALNETDITLKVGQKRQLKVRGKSNFIKWSSENKNIASINRFGRVTAKNSGKTVITAITSGKKLTCTIYVEET